MDKISNFLRQFLLTFALAFLIILIWESFFGNKEESKKPTDIITIVPVINDIAIGNLAEFKITNYFSKTISFTNPCAKDGSVLQIHQKLSNGDRHLLKDFANICTEKDKQISSFELAQNESYILNFKNYNRELFGKKGEYQIELTFKNDKQIKKSISNAISIDDAGFFRNLFRTFILKPLFTALVFFIDILPSHSFGWAIILLTIIVRLILFIPNQKAMKSQRELQKLQPKIAEIRKEHAGNQQMLAMKMMEMYKTHKINPMGSCLPILLQMPVFIGIYFVVKDGISEHLGYLLFDFYTTDLSIVNHDFLGMNLEYPGSFLIGNIAIQHIWILAILVGIAQFIAIKLSLISANKKKQIVPKESEKKKTNSNFLDGMGSQMESMQKIMLWVFPVMIAIFTLTFPAGVGIYWFVSTVFGIGQQKLVNWQLDKSLVRRKV